VRGIYSSPLRVYLILAALAAAGIASGLRLPISLFPNSTKPRVRVRLEYRSITADEFLNTYGRQLEDRLHAVSTDRAPLDKLTADYGSDGVRYTLEFKWGTAPREALRETQDAVQGFAGRFPPDIRDSLGVWTWNTGSGFFALSFYSETRSLDDLYDVIEPILTPRLASRA
jgi:multidrug efflux pump subunit AcrB